MPKAKAKPKRKAPAKKKRVVRKKPQQDGEGFREFLQGVNKFLKKTKIISGIASGLSVIPGVGEIAGPAAAISGSLGYGMKKKKPRGKKGKGLNQPGGSLSLPGRRRQVPQVIPYR